MLNFSIIKIVLRIMIANKLRSGFAISSISLGLALLIGMVIIQTNIDSAFKNEIKEQYGDADLMVGYRHNLEPKSLDNEQVEKIKKTVGVKEIGKVLVNPEQYIRQTIERNGIMYTAVDNSQLTKSIYHFNSSLSSSEVVINERLAKKKNVNIGQSIILDFKNGSNSTWKVVEIVPDLLNMTSNAPDIVLLNIDTVGKVLKLEGMYNQIIINVGKGIDKEDVAQKIAGSIDSNISIDMLDQMDKKKAEAFSFQIFGYVISIISVFASIIIVRSSINASIRERIVELATIRSLGATRKQLISIVIIEILLTVMLGCIIGSFFGGIIAESTSDTLVSYYGLKSNVGSDFIRPLIITIFYFIIVILLSLAPFKKVYQISPIEAFRESNHVQTIDWHNKKYPKVFTLIGGGLFASSFFVSNDDLIFFRLLLSVFGALFIVISVFIGVKFIVKFFLNNTLKSNKFQNKLLIIAKRYLQMNIKQTVIIILVIGIGLSLAMPVLSLLNSIGNEMNRNLNNRYVTDFILSSSKINRSTLKIPEVIKDIEAINGVKLTIPLSVSNEVRLLDYNFEKSDKEWYTKNSRNSLRSNFKGYELLNYVSTDFKKLNSLGLLEPIHDPKTEVIITEQYAKDLGVRVGEVLTVDAGKKNVTVSIGAIVESLPGYPTKDRIMFVDDSNSIIENTSNLRNPDVPVPKNVAEFILVSTSGDIDQVIDELDVLATNKYDELRWSNKEQEANKIRSSYIQRAGFLWGAVVIINFIAIMSIFNTINLSIHAFRREFALLRVVYLRPSQLKYVIILQAIVLSSIGTAVGITTGTIMSIAFLNALKVTILLPITETLLIALLLIAASIIVTLPMASKLTKLSVIKTLRPE